jgi:hypothetical protein
MGFFQPDRPSHGSDPAPANNIPTNGNKTLTAANGAGALGFPGKFLRSNVPSTQGKMK